MRGLRKEATVPQAFGEIAENPRTFILGNTDCEIFVPNWCDTCTYSGWNSNAGIHDFFMDRAIAVLCHQCMDIN